MKHRLTPQEYVALVHETGGRCAACGHARERMVVDHHHATGIIRSLLCNGCNTALGFLQEDPARIRALADYAEGWNEAIQLITLIGSVLALRDRLGHTMGYLVAALKRGHWSRWPVSH